MAEQDESKSINVKNAREILQALLRARKNLRLYPSNNPIYVKLVAETHNKFKEFFAYKDTLELRFTRGEVIFESENVYQSEAKDDNLALFFFRDGLRELKFEKTLDERELEEFLKVISFDFDREDVEDDLVTLLWEKDFHSIKYKVDETLLVEDESYEEKAVAEAKEGSCKDEFLKLAYDEALRSDEKHTFTVMPITDSDLKALVKEIEQDSEDKVSKLANIIFDMIAQAEDAKEFQDYAQILNNAIDYCMRTRDLKQLVGIITRTKRLYEDMAQADLKKILRGTLSHVASPKLIYEMGGLLDSVSGFDEDAFGEYVALLGADAIAPFLNLLAETKTGAGKKRVMNALLMIGRKDIDALAMGLRDPNAAVVRNVVAVMRAIGDRRVVDHLMSVIMHEDQNVRRDVVLTIGELGSEEAVPALKPFLEDDSVAVRLAAAKAMGKIGSDVARDFILEKINGKSVFQAEMGEVKGYFEVLSRWREPGVIEALKDIMNKKHLFNRASHNQLKAGAIYCLGLMADKGSLDDLRKLASSGDGIIADFARAAIKRIEHGQ